MEHQQTIQVRIQVIDMKPQVLDLRVPVYLKASDLSQRIIRDAGLEPFWPNRKRKLYWMRARGRLLQDHETLQELGVIDNELIYILPQPLPEMGVVEQNPDYPKVNDYLGQGLPLLVFMLFAIIAWSFCWGFAINASRHLLVSILPSMGVSVLCISFSRHAWGGSPSDPKIGGTAFFLYTLSVLFASLTPLALREMTFTEFILFAVPGYVSGVAVLPVAWLAWWGSVEPLPKHRVVEEKEEEVQQHTCAICQQAIEDEVLTGCKYGKCGRAFHVGCRQAREMIYRGPSSFCEVCQDRVA